MLEDHDCDTCDKSRECEIKEALESCRDAYEIGIDKLANIVAAAIDTDVDEELKVVWMGVSLELIGYQNSKKISNFVKLVSKEVQNKELCDEVKMQCLMIISNQIMGKAAALASSIGDSMGLHMRFHVVDRDELPHVNVTVH